MAYLRIANLKKKYRISRTEYQEVLKGIDVEFKRGELFACYITKAAALGNARAIELFQLLRRDGEI